MEISEEQKKRELEEVSRYSDKNEKLSWKRKMKKMEGLIEKLQPYEEQILKIILKKQPIMDAIDELRNKMVKECVHPIEYLSHQGDHVLCKFCNSKIKVVNFDDE